MRISVVACGISILFCDPLRSITIHQTLYVKNRGGVGAQKTNSKIYYYPLISSQIQTIHSYPLRSRLSNHILSDPDYPIISSQIQTIQSYPLISRLSTAYILNAHVCTMSSGSMLYTIEPLKIKRKAITEMLTSVFYYQYLVSYLNWPLAAIWSTINYK